MESGRCEDVCWKMLNDHCHQQSKFELSWTWRFTSSFICWSLDRCTKAKGGTPGGTSNHKPVIGWKIEVVNNTNQLWDHCATDHFQELQPHCLPPFFGLPLSFSSSGTEGSSRVANQWINNEINKQAPHPRNKPAHKYTDQKLLARCIMC